MTAQGRRRFSELTKSAGVSTEQIAARECRRVEKINLTISLAFPTPDLTEAAMEGRLPRGNGMTQLSDLPAQWSLQRQALGLAQLLVIELVSAKAGLHFQETKYLRQKPQGPKVCEACPCCLWRRENEHSPYAGKSSWW